MRRFFEVFLFEDVPAADRRPDNVYLDEVRRCDVYLGLLGNEYGFEDGEAISPTEREFDAATAEGKYRLVYVKGSDDTARHPQMHGLVAKAQAGLIRKRFNTPAELVAGVYAALVEYLERKDLIRSGPFDAAPCTKASFDDLDPERMAWFVRTARNTRGFPLTGDAMPEELLKHLNLLDDNRLTNAALLLFGSAPQRFLISSEIKCAHFHGIDVAKPIPSYQVYKGSLFKLVDDAVDFVLSKIALSVGTRAESVQAPVRYEIPREVVVEAIVNAVVHRDYTSTGSVQVMLFADRLEVWNPGGLPPSLTLGKLRVAHGSVPRNPLVAEPMYLAGYIERMGTGTRDMIRRCVDAGIAEPEFSISDGFKVAVQRPVPATGQVTPEVAGEVTREVTPEATPEVRLARVLRRAMTRKDLQQALGLRDDEHFRTAYLLAALDAGLIEMTIPEKPTSPLQKYRLTDKGRAMLSALPPDKPHINRTNPT